MSQSLRSIRSYASRNTYGLPAELLFLHMVGGCGTGQIDPQSMRGNELFVFGEEFGRSWRVGQEEEGSHCNYNRDRAFDEEYPGLLHQSATDVETACSHPHPIIVSMKLDLAQPSGQQSTKRTTQRCGTVKDAESEHQIVPLVEHAQIENDAPEHSAFASTEKQATGDKAAIGFNSTHARANDSPSHG
jgi:hypothetical protein